MNPWIHELGFPPLRHLLMAMSNDQVSQVPRKRPSVGKQMQGRALSASLEVPTWSKAMANYWGLKMSKSSVNHGINHGIYIYMESRKDYYDYSNWRHAEISMSQKIYPSAQIRWVSQIFSPFLTPKLASHLCSQLHSRRWLDSLPVGDWIIKIQVIWRWIPVELLGRWRHPGNLRGIKGFW